MNNGIHFISGLPRSGSTLLSAIFRQNPFIHAGMSSPVGGLCQRLIAGMGPQGEFNSLITDVQRQNILHSVVDGYYKDIHPTKLVIDTNRLWCSKMATVARLYPEARVIVCVRELLWIMDSFERILSKNPLITSKMFKRQNGATVFTRLSSLGSGQGTVGFAWNAVQEAFYSEFADRLIVVDYEALTRQPQRTMEAIYEALGLPAFEHDFENVSYKEGDEFDSQLGVPGLHTVGRKVRYVERPSVLPPELIERFSGRAFWRRPAANRRKVKVILPVLDGAARRPQGQGFRMQQGGGEGRRPQAGV
jgi:sulfotransferase